MRSDVSRIATQVQCPVRVLHNPTNTLPGQLAATQRSCFRRASYASYGQASRGCPGARASPRSGNTMPNWLSGRATTPSHHLLATVMFEDVVGSTTLVSQIGDDAWGSFGSAATALCSIVWRSTAEGVVSTAGDGSMCTVPGPAVAIRCARAAA